ncbi:MAG: peptidylprolyl isomerase [Pseudoflavonifractor sp.]|nr:peptidylprolyl isomerase [Alloprevotella sp.]MCM1116595.1 peptidylprolyl isomerase [Pseudoflavonifractor sp.]
MTSLRNAALAAILLPAAVFAVNQAPSAMDHNTTPLVNESIAPKEDVIVEMNTSMGPVKLLLYGDTPRHLDNFVKLASEGFYDGLLFHRVINEFMVQGGDPDSRNASSGARLGAGDVDYQIDAEIVYPRHFHKRGALAAARQGDSVNPEKKSSGSQFYIVTGKTYTDAQLDQMEQRLNLNKQKEIFDSLVSARHDSIMAMRRNRDQAALQALQEKLVAQSAEELAKAPVKFTPEQREAYTTVGGTPHLDNAYTVYGEVIEGMDVIDAIQKAETDPSDRPLSDIRILSMKVEGPAKK